MATFKLIQSATVPSGGSSAMDFTNIPQTYTDLCIKFSIRNNRVSGGPGYLQIKFNDSTSNYSTKVIYTATDYNYNPGVQTRSDNYISFAINTTYSTASTFGSGEIYVPSYTSSNYKSLSSESISEWNGDWTGSGRNMWAMRWSDTSSITKISLYTDDSPFLQYSTAYLYGIKNS